MYLSTNRLPWVDAARMFAMLTVVTAHCISFARLPNIDSFIYWIVAWELPLFTMLSGYVSQKGLYRITTWTGLWNHAIKLSNRMLVPAAMFGLLIQSSFIGFLDGKTLKPIIAMCVWLTLIALYILSKSNNGKFYAKILALAAIVIELHSKHMWYLSMLFCIMIVFSISNVICSKLKKTENYSALLYTLFVIIWGGAYRILRNR
jgi:hypothetical protein